MFKLSVENFRVIKSAELLIDKGINVLYGPNGGGKSSLIYALLSMLGIKDDKLKDRLRLENNTVVNIITDRYLRFDRGKYVCNELSGSVIDEINNCLKKFWDDIGVRRVGVVTGDYASVYNVGGDVRSEYEQPIEVDVWDQGDWDSLTSKPQLTYPLLETLHDFNIAEYLHSGYALKNSEWIPIELLSYGERKAVSLLLTAFYSDLIVVEGFEAGLHLDLELKLLRSLEDKIAIIETHMGLIVSTCLRNEWNIYYVDRGSAEKITKENILRKELFAREWEMYVRQ